MTSAKVFSSDISMSGISEGNRRGLLGRGEGARGPSGRRSEECCDVERKGLGDSVLWIGVVDRKVGVVER